jgi:hypothetical protein
MIQIGIGGSVDVQKIRRLIRSDEVLVGYPDGVAHPGTDMQNSDLARLLHFGSRRIPARPWLYDSILAVADELRVKLRRMLQRDVREGREPEGENSLEGIGAFLVGAVQGFVRGGRYKETQPNAPSTRKRKGSDTPLIDSAFMINSTTYLTRRHRPAVRERELRP